MLGFRPRLNLLIKVIIIFKRITRAGSTSEIREEEQPARVWLVKVLLLLLLEEKTNPIK